MPETSWRDDEGAELRRKLVDLYTSKVGAAAPVSGSFAVECDLDTGLRCLLVLLKEGSLSAEECRRLTDRANVLLKGRHMYGLRLQVK
jgi:hypothetical protein